MKGAAELVREEMIQLAAAVLQAPAEAIELADGFARIKDGPEEAALPFMALGAIINANNAFLPPDFNPTLNHRYVCRPYFGMVDTEKKTGQLTLTYATQIHAAVVEIDPETGEVDVVDYAAVDDCGVRINPQIVEGQVHGATAHAIGARSARGVRLRRGGDAPHRQLLRLPRATRAGHAAAEDRRDGVAVAGRAARREGDGRRRRRRDPLHLRGDPGRARGQRAAPSSTTAATRRIGCGRCSRTRKRRARTWRWRRSDRLGNEGARPRPRETVWSVINEPAEMAKLMPGVECFEITDEKHWTAKVKVPLGLGGLKMTMNFEKLEEREPEFASMRAKGQGVGALMDMTTSFTLSEAGDGTSMAWEADVKIAGPVGAMGQRVLQPIVNQQVSQVLAALEERVRKRPAPRAHQSPRAACRHRFASASCS